MSIPFRVGRYIDPSGFGLAVVDIPEIDAEKNISLIDYSHRWEENVASSDRSVISSYVDAGGHMPLMTVTDFVVTNITTTSTNDSTAKPLYYRHRCRFFHYTYGENPGRQVYITDQYGNIIKDINYLVKVEKVTSAANVYKVDILTDFYNNSSAIYKVKYNRCTETGSDIFLGWIETLNATPYFTEGNPTGSTTQYSMYGPDSNGMYAAIVPPVPTLSELVNSIGISFANCPTIVAQDVTNNMAEYAESAVVVYTLKATSPTTFTVKRSHDRYGNVSNLYLQSATSDSWGLTPVNFTIGIEITALYGQKLWVYNEKYLKTGDEAYFTAKKSYYYLMPIAYSAIYLKKPEHVTESDDWYLRIKNGRFRRRMDASGNPVPSGVGTQFEYAIPEWNEQLWSLHWGPPYRETLNERVELLDKNTLQLQRTPLFIDPSSVLYNPSNPGFPPSSYLRVAVNDVVIPENQVMDWDVYNGTIKLAQILTHRDDIVVSYNYREDYYEYPGYLVSGVIGNPYWETLDLNPTPSHNYGIYASGISAHIYLSPYINVDTLTVLTNRPLYHNFTGVPSGIYDFEIGNVSVGPHCKITDVKITDVRVRGGGLSKLGRQELDKVKEVQPESEFFWDVGYFDGQAVPANGVLVIKIPKGVLSNNGGPFTEDEVMAKVKKHMALGEYPIIEYV